MAEILSLLSLCLQADERERAQGENGLAHLATTPGNETVEKHL
jgi:hypothetical protein